MGIAAQNRHVRMRVYEAEAMQALQTSNTCVGSSGEEGGRRGGGR